MGYCRNASARKKKIVRNIELSKLIENVRTDDISFSRETKHDDIVTFHVC